MNTITQKNGLIELVAAGIPPVIPESMRIEHGLNWSDSVREQNLVKFTPNNNAAVNVTDGSKSIVFTIPKNGLINFKKGFLNFKIQAVKDAAGAFVAFPLGINTIFKSLKIKCGQQLLYEENWGRIRNIEKMCEWDDREFDFTPQLGHNTFALRKTAGAALTEYAINLDINLLSCTLWDMDNINDVLEITFFLCDPNEVLESDVNGTENYTISEVYLWAHRIIESDAYRNERIKHMSSKILNIPFNHYHYMSEQMAAAITSKNTQFNLSYKSVQKCYTGMQLTSGLATPVVTDKYTLYDVNGTVSYQWKICGRPFPEEAIVCNGYGGSQAFRWTMMGLGLWDGEHGPMGNFTHLRKYFVDATLPCFIFITDFTKHAQDVLGGESLIDGLDFSRYIGDANLTWTGAALGGIYTQHHWLLINNVLQIDYVRKKVSVLN